MKKDTPGIASLAQIRRITELTSSHKSARPIAALLKNITDGRASSPDELTCAQANNVINLLAR